jgi:hypothetical protein
MFICVCIVKGIDTLFMHAIILVYRPRYEEPSLYDLADRSYPCNNEGKDLVR